MSMQTTLPTQAPTPGLSSPAKESECLTTYIFCGDGISSCFSDTGWTIDLTAIDSDAGNTLFCTVRVGSGQCDEMDNESIDLGSFQIDAHQMVASPLTGFIAKEFRIVSSAHTDKPESRFLATEGQNETIPVGANDFVSSFISIFLTVCECSELQQGCDDASGPIVMSRSTVEPTMESKVPNDLPSTAPSVDSATLTVVDPALQVEAESGSTVDRISSNTGSTPKIALVLVAVGLFVLAMFLALCLYCSRLQKKRTVTDDASEGSLSKDDNDNLSPWSDIEI